MTATELILPAPLLILEDDVIMQQRLKQLLFKLGYIQDTLIFAQSVKQALQVLAQHHIAFALVDLGLPDGSGLDFIQALRQKDQITPVLVISAWSIQETILHAIQIGATGYILKERDDFEIILSIRSALRGGAPIDPFIAQQILEKINFKSINKNLTTAPNDLLSKRELEILNLVSQGMSNREIAEALFLSKYTIECHIKHIYRKLSVSNRSKAIYTARNLGLLA
ncbi:MULTISPECIES: response regulator transcription factor [unclassified Acinetobacter]|uniref:response regulator transcription factor n=1 Tax=unclassified Acinetobacter TaxID=196816 RepID=UPI0029346E2E|nr:MULTISPECIES: response regulator transcription factor [unclassified Acinetobacter]WOE32223.1 response regulator transcription factor [Acinetobacter sp. SAAs470]WOE37693.1 response regulator transcription factor [Acinetobacter sp. SAAs474]